MWSGRVSVSDWAFRVGYLCVDGGRSKNISIPGSSMELLV